MNSEAAYVAAVAQLRTPEVRFNQHKCLKQHADAIHVRTAVGSRNTEQRDNCAWLDLQQSAGAFAIDLGD